MRDPPGILLNYVAVKDNQPVVQTSYEQSAKKSLLEHSRRRAYQRTHAERLPCRGDTSVSIRKKARAGWRNDNRADRSEGADRDHARRQTHSRNCGGTPPRKAGGLKPRRRAIETTAEATVLISWLARSEPVATPPPRRPESASRTTSRGKALGMSVNAMIMGKV